MSGLVTDLEALAGFSAPGPGTTRLAWSLELEDALAWCSERMEEAGLDTERDAAGNLIGRWKSGQGRAVLAGSHLDTVPNGGRYDGSLGVLGAVEAVRRLRDEGFTPARPIWVAAFMDEEGARFGTSMLGSRAFVGDSVAELGKRLDNAGVSLASAVRECGRSLDEAAAAQTIDAVGDYLELHIEQGSVLEELDVDIGVVTAITGMVGLRVSLTGVANHAGTTPMNRRNDALAGASRVIVALRDAARRSGSFVVTVGEIGVLPGAANVVPGEATFSVDLRAPEPAALAEAEEVVGGLLTRVCDEEGLESSVLEKHRLPPTRMDPLTIAAIEEAAREVGARAIRLTSGAGHDAMVLGRHVAAGMVFVPSRGGVSHAPEEFTEARLCELGVAVLAGALKRLASHRDVTRQ